MNNDLISRSEAKKLGATCLARRNENGQLEAIISLDNAPTVEPTIKPICEVKFDHEKLKEIVDKAIIRCQDCKHQKKYWHEDKRMKEKGYWVYGCDLIDDSFVGTPVWGSPDQFCSSAESRELNEQESDEQE